MEAFRVVRPREGERPLIVEIPHAGLLADGRALATMQCSATSLARDADLYVDELYDAAHEAGATILAAHTSRYMVDLNRSEEDVDEESVVGAGNRVRATRGLIWRLTSAGEPILRAPLSQEELARRVETYYRPYHRELSSLIADTRRRFGYAVVLAAHSMPDSGKIRADIVPGTQGRTSASGPIIDAVDQFWTGHDYHVVHDTPYRGGFVTQFYGRPREHVHVVQLELARRLYMDDVTLAPDRARFANLRSHCSAFIRALAQVKP